MSEHFSQAVKDRFDNTRSQERLRAIHARTLDMDVMSPSFSDLKDFGSATVIKIFSPLTLGVCIGEELTARVTSRIKRKVSGI